MPKSTIVPTLAYKDLPDTITPELYSKWRGIGKQLAENRFHSKGFPLIPDVGNRLIADKRTVLLYELGLSGKEKDELLKKIAIEIVQTTIFKNTEEMEE